MKLPKLVPLVAISIPLLFAGFVAPQNPSATNNWLRFRGPNGTGVAEGPILPSEFGANKNLVLENSCAVRAIFASSHRRTRLSDS